MQRTYWAVPVLLAFLGSIILSACNGDDTNLFGSTPGGNGSAVPLITGLVDGNGAPFTAATTAGDDASGNDITLTIEGDDFIQGATVRFQAANADDFDASHPQVDATGTFFSVLSTNTVFVDESRIDVTDLPASVIDTPASGAGTVTVQVLNPGGFVSTDGSPNGTNTVDEFTYFDDSVTLGATVAQSGDLAGAWNTIFPGQNGIQLQATLTNMTPETVQNITLQNISLDWTDGSSTNLNPYILNWKTSNPATSLASSASTTVDFMVSTTNDLPAGVTATGTVTWSATGQTSGISYSGSGTIDLTTGATPSINTSGGASQGGTTGGDAAQLTIDANDGAGNAAVTLGATSGVTAVAEEGPALGATQTDSSVAAMEAGSIAVGMTQKNYFLNETFDLADTGGTTTWDFNNDFPLVFQGCTFNIAVPGDVQPLDIQCEGTVQFFNCTFNFGGRNVATGAGTNGSSLSVQAADTDASATGILSVDQTTITTTGGSGDTGGTGGGITLETSEASAGLTITNSQFVTTGGRADDGTAGNAGAISLVSSTGTIGIAENSTFDTRGGFNLGPAPTAGGGGGGGAFTIDTTDAAADNEGAVTLDGRIDTRGGDSVDGDGGAGGAVSITGEGVSIGNANSAPVLVANGGSNSVPGGHGGVGGDGNAIQITSEGNITIPTNAALIAIGGGADNQDEGTNSGSGGGVSLDCDDDGNAADTLSMDGVIDASGGWTRVATTGAAPGAAAPGGQNVTLDSSGETNVGGVIFNNGGNPARSDNTQNPVGSAGAVNGGNASNIIIDAGDSTVAANRGQLVIDSTAIIAARGGFYLSGGAGGDGNTIDLGGEGIDLSGKVVANGGSAAEPGQADGGDGGAITVLSDYAAGSTVVAGELNISIAGTIRSNGGNAEKNLDSSGNFTASAAVGAGGSIAVRVDNTDPGPTTDGVTIAANGRLEARGDTTTGGSVLVSGSADGTDGDTINDGGNLTLEDGSVLVAGGDGASVLARIEDDATLTVNGTVTLENDQPAGTASLNGQITLEGTSPSTGASGQGTLVDINTTAEILVRGGSPGTIGIQSNEPGTGNAVDLDPSFIRNEDQTPGDGAADADAGNISIFSSGAINHQGGEITARGQGATGGGDGGQITFNTEQGGGDNIVLSGGTVDASSIGTDNGTGGTILFEVDSDSAITVQNIVSANGLGTGDGGTIDFDSDAGGWDLTVNTTTAISAAGGDNAATPSAAGIPISGGDGGSVTAGTTNRVGTIAWDADIDVSGGDNAAGPGGFGGFVTLQGNNAGADSMTFGANSTITFNLSGGASTFSAAFGGTAGEIVMNGNGPGTPAPITIANTNAVTFNLNGGTGPSGGGDAGLVEIVNDEAGAPINAGPTGGATMAVTVTGGASGGQNGQVRLVQVTDAGNDVDTTNLTVNGQAAAAAQTAGTLVIVD